MSSPSPAPPGKAPTVTTRRYITWNPATATETTENTSTLVLTSPRGYFVDIRLLLQSPLRTSDYPVPLIHDSLLKPHNAILPPSALDWAFAGVATSGPTRPNGRQYCAWRHLLDNRVPTSSQASQLKDEGWVKSEVADPDALGGRTEWESEVGEMKRPNAGVEPYEEGWLSLPPRISGAGVRPCPGFGEGAVSLSRGQDERVECVVLRLRSKARGEKIEGMVVRVEGWCQVSFAKSYALPDLECGPLMFPYLRGPDHIR